VTGLRIGVLGASRIAEKAIVGPAQELGHRLVAVAARDPQRAAAFAGKFGVERVLGSYAEVIDDAEVDVVYNPLANALHAPWNLAAITAGKPVLSEKPFARNRSEAATVARAAEAAGVTVLEGFHYFFHPVTQRAFALAASGEIGRLTRVEVRMAMPAPDDDDPRWSMELAGGALMDLGCYGMHVLRSSGRLDVDGLRGAPSIVAARAEQRSTDVDATCDVEVGFPGGATGLTANSMVAPEYSFTIKIVGSEGEVLVHDFIRPNDDDRITVRTAAGERVERLGTRASYTYQLEAFADHVQNGAALPFGLADAVTNMAYVDAAYQAAGLPPR
jgi:predicted dehydrogenase